MCIIRTPQKNTSKCFLDWTSFKVIFQLYPQKFSGLCCTPMQAKRQWPWVCYTSLCYQFCSLSRHIFLPKITRVGKTLCLHLAARSIQLEMGTWNSQITTHTIAKNLQGPSLHIWSSDIERNSDIKLIRHRLPFHQPKLPNMITMVCRVYYIRIFQFSCFSQHIVNLKKSKTKYEIYSTE